MDQLAPGIAGEQHLGGTRFISGRFPFVVAKGGETGGLACRKETLGGVG